VEIGQIVSAHDPDELAGGIAAHESGEHIDGVAGAELPLDRGRADSRMAGDALGRREACGERRHVARLVLERIAGRDEQPEIVETKRFDRTERDAAMPRMAGIE